MKAFGIGLLTLILAGITPVMTFAQEKADAIYHGGSILTMAGVNTAANKKWTLTTLGSEKIEVAIPPTMMFAGGKLSVFGGVNRLTGSYALVRDTVTMSDLVSTRMAGPQELMEMENKYAKMLKSVDSFHVHGDELTLSSGGKVVAAFRSGR